jgi:hypothetical protein
MFPGLNKVYLMTLDSYPSEYEKYLNIESSSLKDEDDIVIDGFGLVPEKGEGDPPTFDFIKQSNEKNYLHKTYVLGYEVTEELFEDEQYGVINKATAMLATAVKQTRDTLGANVLNNGFATTIYLGVDAKGLCATDHPLSKSGGTVANRPAVEVDFDATSLASALQTIETWKDANGLPMLKRPKYVISGPNQRDIITKVLGSEKMPGTNDNDLNAVREWELEKMILHYLTDDDAWWITTRPMDHYMKWFDRVKPKFKNYDDPNTGNARFTTRFRCSSGFTTWQGVYGSQGI